MKKFFLFLGLLGPGLVLSYAALVSLAWGVWGAPVGLGNWVALVSGMALCGAAFLCFWSVQKAFLVAKFASVIWACLFIPGIALLVPSKNIVIDPMSFIIVAILFGVLGFVLLYPKRSKTGMAIFALLIGWGGWVYQSTYNESVSSGEYNWPSLDFYSVEGEEPLSLVGHIPAIHIRGDFSGPTTTTSGGETRGITDQDVQLLSRGGLKGELRWRGASGELKAAQTAVVVICRDWTDEPRKIHFPKSGKVFHIFENGAWRTIPEDFDSYERFVELQPDGMLSQQLQTGGTQFTRVYW
jgi:hypothetical protein